jgi:serine/threonine protein kinase
VNAGDRVGRYRVLRDGTTAGGGRGEWSVAERDGRLFFLKRFLAPKYVVDDPRVSPALRARSSKDCVAFEQRHFAIQRAIDPHAHGAGNLVLTLELFRHGAQYYKTTEWLDAVPAAEHPPRHTSEQLLVVLRTLVLSLRLLHRSGIVHGDLKPDNILLKRSPRGVMLAKLIDFDDAYFSGSPPPAAEIVGTDQWFSPEVFRYAKNGHSVRPVDITTASDVFSLGLVLHHLLVGRHPGFDRGRFTYPCAAVAAGHRLDVSALRGSMRELVASMLGATGRPAVELVADYFLSIGPVELDESPEIRQVPRLRGGIGKRQR